MPSRRRPHRRTRRRTSVLHPVTSRQATRSKRPRRPTAPKAVGPPPEFRDTAPPPAHVLFKCALPGCTTRPQFMRADAKYCCPAHRLKHWRQLNRENKEREARAQAAAASA